MKNAKNINRLIRVKKLKSVEESQPNLFSNRMRKESVNYCVAVKS